LPSRTEVEILPDTIPFSLTEYPAGKRRPGGRFRFLTVMFLLGALLLSGCEKPKETGSDGAVARPPADLAAWILADRLPVRLTLQQHKILWGKDTRGV